MHVWGTPRVLMTQLSTAAMYQALGSAPIFQISTLALPGKMSKRDAASEKSYIQGPRVSSSSKRWRLHDLSPGETWSFTVTHTITLKTPVEPAGVLDQGRELDLPSKAKLWEVTAFLMFSDSISFLALPLKRCTERSREIPSTCPGLSQAGLPPEAAGNTRVAWSDKS